MNNTASNTQVNRAQAVTNLQRYLRRLSFEEEPISYQRPPIDGIYDSATEDAVANFQRRHGIPATGIADKLTWDMIFQEYLRVTEEERFSKELSIFPDAPTDYAISRGDALTLVRILQLLLLELRVTYDAFEDIVENGIFDDRTEAAIKEFQQANLLPVTGEVDRATWNRIIREYANLALRGD